VDNTNLNNMSKNDNKRPMGLNEKSPGTDAASAEAEGSAACP